MPAPGGRRGVPHRGHRRPERRTRPMDGVETARRAVSTFRPGAGWPRRRYVSPRGRMAAAPLRFAPGPDGRGAVPRIAHVPYRRRVGGADRRGVGSRAWQPWGASPPNRQHRRRGRAARFGARGQVESGGGLTTVEHSGSSGTRRRGAPQTVAGRPPDLSEDEHLALYDLRDHTPLPYLPPGTGGGAAQDCRWHASWTLPAMRQASPRN